MGLVLPSMVMATCCPIPAIQSAASQNSAAIASQTSTITGAMTMQTNTLAKAITASSKATRDISTGVAAKVADDSNRKAVGRKLAETTAKAGSRYQLPTHDCFSLTNSSKLIGSREISKIRADTLSRGLTYRNLNAATAPKEESRKIFSKHLTQYCGDQTADLLGCKKTTLPDADITVGSLLMGAGLPGKSRDYTFSDRQVDAGKSYIKNVISALPEQHITPEAAKLPAGQALMVKQMSKQAKLSLAAKPFVDSLAWRSPQPGLGGQIAKIWAAEKQIGISVPPDFKGKFQGTDAASPYSFLQTEVDRRAGNPQWLIDFGKSSPEARVTEQGYMQALQLQLSMNQIMRMEKIELLLGGIYAQLVESGPEEKALRKAQNQLNASVIK